MPKTVTKPIPLEPFERRPSRVGKKRRKVKNPLVIMGGLPKLRRARRTMIAKEYSELRLLAKQPNSQEAILKKIKRIESLEVKARAFTGRRIKQKNWFTMHDPEFPLLLNRLFFFESMRKNIQNPGEHSLTYIDMNNLKRVNRRFGRAEGGMEVLRAFSRALAGTIPKNGIAGHIGGDEFIVYLPMNAKDAKGFLKKSVEPLWATHLKKWKNYPQALASFKSKAPNKITLTYSSGIIKIARNADLVKVEHAADLLCKMAKRNKQVSTTSISSSLEKFEKKLAKKRAKI